MTFDEWEIWHTFATYFKASVPDLESVAYNFVKSQFAEYATLRDGMCFWTAKDGVQPGFTTIELSGSRNKADFHVQPLDGKDTELADYCLEAWLTAAKFRYGEIRLLGEDSGLPHNYIRAFPGFCQLVKEEEEIVGCFPVVTLYESGVLLVQFRLIGPERPIQIEEFINTDLNLFQNRYDKIEGPPSISSLASIAYNDQIVYQHLSPRQRFFLPKLEQLHDAEVKKRTRSEKIGDFTFQLAPLTQSDAQSWETVTTLAHTFFSIVAYLITKPRHNFKTILFGKKPLVQLGDYWSGRPHVHIVRHKNQAETASKNEQQNKSSFGWIMARSYMKDEGANQHLPQSVRLFEDYRAYVNIAVVLWVWSKRGLKLQEPWDDMNRGHLIYENEAQGLLLEYGYMLHKSLLESLEEITTTKEALKTRKILAQLKSQMDQISYYGEVREFLNKGWESLDLRKIKDQINENLSIIETETRFLESQRADKLGKVITVFFGLIAAPTFAEAVIKPLWIYFGFWSPTNSHLAQVFFSVLTIAIFLIAIYTFFKTSSRIVSKKST